MLFRSGVGAVIAMVSLGFGVKENIKNNISKLGSNLLVITAGGRTATGARLAAGEGAKLTYEDGEVDGRAAMAVASSLLADAIHGKGILLGGVTGIVPCEVTIIGSNMTACAAARSAIGLGATVRMFDNDGYRLREALLQLGPGVTGSSLHPRVFENALRSAPV